MTQPTLLYQPNMSDPTFLGQSSTYRVYNKIINTKANAPEVVGNPRQKTKPPKNWAEMDAKERRENWGNILEGFNKNT